MFNFNSILKKNINISIYYAQFIYMSWKTSWWYILWITTKSELVIDMYYKYIKNYILLIMKHTPLRFSKLSDILVYDRVTTILRFFIIYIISSYGREFNLKVRLNVSEKDSIITSVSNILYSSNWSERECMDMYGLKFYGHKDLRRIIGDYGLWGFPGRRDYPLVGLYTYLYCILFLRVFRVRGIFLDFWSTYFQKNIVQI